jgi:NMD protein affecting ribosome stability and mRNA decay
MFDSEEFDNNHRCASCGVTGGGVEDGLCESCLLAEEGE